MTTENLNMEAMHQMAEIYARLGQSNPDFIVSENAITGTLTAWGQEVRIWDMDWRVEA